MKTMTLKSYDAVIRCEDGEEYAVNIGVLDEETPCEAYWDSWIDPRIYFNLSAAELDALAVGDEIAEGDILIFIDKEPSIMTAEYDPLEYEETV
jgi:hypothetical protein